ncbi:MAG: D-alanyl-D-alanine carboxypeptidase [Micavibrio sp.]|nr:D-alanyl-D-alanine carboxypeptidase [Micavibrio sp.]|tara:strand:- start:188 stop:1324 length:1137 start_codon:yes stop_codon:yes gene_type:complete
MRFLAFLSILAVSLSAPTMAQASVQTEAKQAIIVDYDTGTVLFAKNPDQQMPTSSMSKVMTLYMVFDALKKGVVKMDDTFLVSEGAWRKGGSKMFVEVNKRVSVEDLIRGVSVQSGNDATIVLAEGLSGTEDAFAHAMTAKAKEMGMENSNFANASGWPDPLHYSTARDLAVLTKHLIQDFPEHYSVFSEKEFTYNNITQKNRNPLLFRNMGADGVKTGHTEDGGYGLIGSGMNADGRRVILVVNGLPSMSARAQESARLLEWALQGFTNKTLYEADDVVAQAEVVYGKESSVAFGVQSKVVLTIPKVSSREIKIEAEYKKPLIAPINKGDEIGTLYVSVPGHEHVTTVPLIAREDVKAKGFFAKTIAKAKQFFAARS